MFLPPWRLKAVLAPNSTPIYYKTQGEEQKMETEKIKRL